MTQKKTCFVLFAVSLCFILFMSHITTLQAAEKPTDLQWLKDQKILTSIFDKDIVNHPERIITRQEFAALLMIAGNQKGTEKEYNELEYADAKTASTSMKPYLAKAASYSILFERNEVTKNYIKPTRKLSRQIAGYMLGITIGTKIDLPLSIYEDYGTANSRTKPYLTGVISAGLMDGASNTLLKPKQWITWEEAASILRNTIEAGYFNDINPQEIFADLKIGKQSEDRKLNHPSGITRSSDGILYIADTDHGQIKMIRNNELSVVAGKSMIKDEKNQSLTGYVDGSAENAVFNQPVALRTVKGGLLVLDSGNHAIRFINTTNKTVSTYAGTGKEGFQNGARKSTQFSNPRGMDITTTGIIYIADTGNQVIRKMDSNGNVSTFAGVVGKKGYKDGKLEEALFQNPTGIVTDNGIIYVADTGNQRIRKIENGMVTTIAGNGSKETQEDGLYLGGFQDGNADISMLDGPTNLTIDMEGTLYVSDSSNSMIRTIKNGKVSTLAGFGQPVYTKSKAWNTYLSQPSGLFISMANGNLYVIDPFLNKIIQLKTNR